jgi:folylpolyglutamate synthase/dihydropteroate synthase
MPDSRRALGAGKLARIVAEVTGVEPAQFPTLAAALDALVTPDAPALLVTGSLTTAGQARSRLRDAPATGG